MLVARSSGDWKNVSMEVSGVLDDVWRGATGPRATKGIALEEERCEVLRDMPEAMAGDAEYCCDMTLDLLMG